MSENFDNFEGLDNFDNQEAEIIESEPPHEKKKTFMGVGGWLGALLEWVVLFVVAFAVAMLIRNFVFIVVHVSGPSMEPTLQDRDWLYVNRFMYTPDRGDIIIFEPHQDAERVYIKRVIALAGDSLYIDLATGDVILNDEVLYEPFINDRTAIGLRSLGDFSRENPFVVDDGYIFVMGDNRNQSRDSRELGQIPLDEIMGRALFRLWPFGAFGVLQ